MRFCSNAGIFLICTALAASFGTFDGAAAHPPRVTSQRPSFGGDRVTLSSASRSGQRNRNRLDYVEDAMRKILRNYSSDLIEEKSLYRSIDPVSEGNKQQPCQQCLYPSFAAIKKILQKYNHCKTVVYTVALYPPANTVPGDRKLGHVHESLSSPSSWEVKFPSPASGKEEGLCNLALVTAGSVVPVENYEGWTMIDIPDELVPVPGQYARSAHTLRATPFLLFPAAERIYYADTKCQISTFYEETRDRNPDAIIIALKHFGWHQNPGNMLSEFFAAFSHLVKRRSPAQDLKEILWQLQKYRAEGFLKPEKTLKLSDNRCLYFQKNTKPMQEFLCTWNCEIMSESMRTQLSFPYAMKKAGLESGKDVEFVSYSYGETEEKRMQRRARQKRHSRQRRRKEEADALLPQGQRLHSMSSRSGRVTENSG